MPRVQRSALLPYSTAQIFELVRDIERYPEFLPWCSEAKIVADEDSEVVAELTIRKGRISERFTTRNVLDFPGSIELRLIHGPFKQLSGLWKFTNLADRGCKVELELDFEMTASLIQRTLGVIFASATGSLVDSFCARARTMYGPAGV